MEKLKGLEIRLERQAKDLANTSEYSLTDKQELYFGEQDLFTEEDIQDDWEGYSLEYLRDIQRDIFERAISE